MARIMLAAYCCLEVVISITACAQDVIEPLHSIRCEESGWYQISEDGRWFAHRFVVDRTTRHIRLFDLNQDPAKLLVCQEPLFAGSMQYDFSRWFVDYAAADRTDTKIFGSRVWDLHDDSGLPKLVVPPGYSLIRTNAAETHLAGVHKDSEGISKLRVWDIRKQPLQFDDYRELGKVKGRIFFFAYVFTPHSGIMAVTDQGLSRWDLNALDKPPVVVPLDDGITQVSVAHEYWRGGTSKGSEPSYVFWKGLNGATVLTDLPGSQDAPRTWEISGQIVTFDGQYLVEKRGEQWWLTEFDADTTSSTMLLDSVTGGFDTVTRLGKSPYLLISITDSLLDGAIFRGLHAYIFSLQDLKAGPVVLIDRTSDRTRSSQEELRELTRSYISSPAGKWLVGRSKTETTVWDLSKPLAAGGSGILPGLKEAARYHFLVNDRWLIMVDNGGRVYFVDMDADTMPRATEFFNLERPGRSGYRYDARQRWFFICDFATRNTYVWDVGQFADRVAKQ